MKKKFVIKKFKMGDEVPQNAELLEARDEVVIDEKGGTALERVFYFKVPAGEENWKRITTNPPDPKILEKFTFLGGC